MSIVTVTDIVKKYRLGSTVVSALNGITFSIEPGEFLAIAGPSGSGKTTILNIISGIESPTSGQIHLEDRNITSFSPDELADFRTKRLGFIFQNFNLLPVLTARENVEYPLILSKQYSSSDRKRLATDALQRVGLKQHLKHRPMELSGGQRQRVAIARAIVTNPAIILADEPTANLDHTTGTDILALMKHINQDKGTTFVFSTHDPKVMALATRIISMQDGLVIEKP